MTQISGVNTWLCDGHNFELNSHKSPNSLKRHEDLYQIIDHICPYFLHPIDMSYNMTNLINDSYLLTMNHKVIFIVSPMHCNHIPRANLISNKCIGCLSNKFRPWRVMHHVRYNSSIIIRTLILYIYPLSNIILRNNLIPNIYLLVFPACLDRNFYYLLVYAFKGFRSRDPTRID